MHGHTYINITVVQNQYSDFLGSLFVITNEWNNAVPLMFALAT